MLSQLRSALHQPCRTRRGLPAAGVTVRANVLPMSRIHRAYISKHYMQDTPRNRADKTLLPLGRRRTLMYFLGRASGVEFTRDPQYSGGARQSLFRHHANSTGCGSTVILFCACAQCAVVPVPEPRQHHWVRFAEQYPSFCMDTPMHRPAAFRRRAAVPVPAPRQQHRVRLHGWRF